MLFRWIRTKKVEVPDVAMGIHPGLHADGDDDDDDDDDYDEMIMMMIMMMMSPGTLSG